MRIGTGYDVHQLVAGRQLVLGGIVIPFEKGLLGHSDADVVVHAICDALLGAAALGDIGLHYPDTDPNLEGISSLKLLTATIKMIYDKGYSIANIDTTVFAQAPKIGPYRSKMQAKLAQTMKIDPDRINIKATTTEGLGTIGSGEGIGAMSVVLLVK